jgi:hypothetical protein
VDHSGYRCRKSNDVITESNGGAIMSNVVKFPYDACRRIHSRKSRRSKNGTPEERASKAAAATPQSEAAGIIEFPCRERTKPTSTAAPEDRTRGCEASDGLPVSPYDDYALLNIARHREAVLAYDRAIDAEMDENASPEAYDGLTAATAKAYAHLMLMARCLVIVSPQTRRGAIHLAKYLASQFNDLVDCKNGCVYLPDEINGRPWPEVFLKSLARGLRSMGAEFPKMKRKRGRPSGADERRSLALQEAIAQIPPHLMSTAVRGLKELAEADR